MKKDARNSLVLPFDKGLIAPPTRAHPFHFINAVALSGGEHDWVNSLICQQGSRGDFLVLEQQEYNVAPESTAETLDGAMVLAGKHKRLNENNIAKAWNLVKPGGLIVVAGDKTIGISSLRKYVANMAEIEGSLSKHHGIVFWFNRGIENWDQPDNKQEPLPGMISSPGMFSPDKVDKGSAILADHFDKRVSGNVADFGAGWGYLSTMLLERAGPKLSRLDLYESDHASLEASKINLSNLETDVSSDVFWHDLTLEPVHRRYNWIIMNPPFHTARKGDPEIGGKFIGAARSALAKSGRLLMVANQHLPYEAMLQKHFAKFEILTIANGFKVIEARV